MWPLIAAINRVELLLHWPAANGRGDWNIVELFEHGVIGRRVDSRALSVSLLTMPVQALTTVF